MVDLVVVSMIPAAAAYERENTCATTNNGKMYVNQKMVAEEMEGDCQVNARSGNTERRRGCLLIPIFFYTTGRRVLRWATTSEPIRALLLSQLIYIPRDQKNQSDRDRLLLGLLRREREKELHAGGEYKLTHGQQEERRHKVLIRELLLAGSSRETPTARAPGEDT